MATYSALRFVRGASLRVQLRYRNALEKPTHRPPIIRNTIPDACGLISAITLSIPVSTHVIPAYRYFCQILIRSWEVIPMIINAVIVSNKQSGRPGSSNSYFPSIWFSEETARYTNTLVSALNLVVLTSCQKE